MEFTARQRLTLGILKAVFRLWERWIPVHDSWSPPKTLAGRDLLRLRLEQLEALRRKS
jgi:hypothetical protein